MSVHEPLVLDVSNASVALGGNAVLHEISVSIARGSFTVVLGPNGGGKSTLLRLMAGLLTPDAGQLAFEGRPMSSWRRKQVAQRLAYLPQSPVAPDLITVRELVARGRHPHLSLWRRPTEKDVQAIERALAQTHLQSWADTPVSHLSGGQRQRVWLALVLAQEAELLLLDEPTTYLDIRHQLDLLDLCAAWHRAGRTIVMVLHDLNLAFRYADTLILIKEGRVEAQGAVSQVLSEVLIQRVFDLPVRLMTDPESGRPMVIPKAGGQP